MPLPLPAPLPLRHYCYAARYYAFRYAITLFISAATIRHFAIDISCHYFRAFHYYAAADAIFHFAIFSPIYFVDCRLRAAFATLAALPIFHFCRFAAAMPPPCHFADFRHARRRFFLDSLHAAFTYAAFFADIADASATLRHADTFCRHCRYQPLLRHAAFRFRHFAITPLPAFDTLHCAATMAFAFRHAAFIAFIITIFAIFAITLLLRRHDIADAISPLRHDIFIFHYYASMPLFISYYYADFHFAIFAFAFAICFRFHILLSLIPPLACH